MGNLLGEPFKSYVNKQIKQRQLIHGKKNRSIEDIAYLNANTAWVKMASGVKINDKRAEILSNSENPLASFLDDRGNTLAKRFVLQSGITNYTDVGSYGVDGYMTGINAPLNPTYGLGGFNVGIDFDANGNTITTGVNSSEFGFSPPPGLVDVSLKCLNRGSIKRTSVKIKAYNKYQFDILDILYLRLGYTVYIEFGNTHYMNNDGELVVAGTQDSLIHDGIGGFLNQEYNESDYTEWLPLIEQKRKQTCGNYEGIFGRVSNFNWSFNEDGSYDINVEIISLGDIIESLKVNIPPLKPRVDKYQQTQNQALQNQLQNSPATFTQFYGTLYPDLEGVLSKWLEGVNDNVSTLTVNQNAYEFDGKNSSTGIYEIDNSTTNYFEFSNLGGFSDINNFPNTSDPELVKRLGDNIKLGLLGFRKGIYNQYTSDEFFALRKKYLVDNAKSGAVKSFDVLRKSSIGAGSGIKNVLTEDTKTQGQLPFIQLFFDSFEKPNVFDEIIEKYFYALQFYDYVRFIEGTDFSDDTNSVNRTVNISSSNTPLLSKYSAAKSGEYLTFDELKQGSYNDYARPIGAVEFGLEESSQAISNEGSRTNQRDYINNTPGAQTEFVGYGLRVNPSESYDQMVGALNQLREDGQLRNEYFFRLTSRARENRIELNDGRTVALDFSSTNNNTLRTDTQYGYDNLQYFELNSFDVNLERNGVPNAPYHPATDITTFGGDNIPQFLDNEYFDKDYFKNFFDRKSIFPTDTTSDAFKFVLEQLKQQIYDTFVALDLAGGQQDEKFQPPPPTEEDKEREEQYENIIFEYFFKIKTFTKKFNELYEGNKGRLPTLAYKSDFLNVPDNIVQLGYVLNPIYYAFNMGDSQLREKTTKAWNNGVGFPLYNKEGKNVDVIHNEKITTNPTNKNYYIRLGTFLDFLQEKVIPKIQSSNQPIVTIDTNIATNICYTVDSIISTDMRKVIVSNSNIFVPQEEEIAQKRLELAELLNQDSSTINELQQELQAAIVRTQNNRINPDELYGSGGTMTLLTDNNGSGNNNAFKNQSRSGYVYGRIMNIYLNIDEIKNICQNSINSSTGQLTLYKLLKDICDMINKCFGNLTNIEPVVSDDTDRQSGQNILEPGLPSGNTIKFIDSTNIPGIEEIANELGIDFQEPQEQLQVFGFNEKSPTTDRESNFVQKVGLKTKIDKNYATMITIGATANGYVPGTEATAFSRWNVGIQDRFKNELTSATAGTLDPDPLKRLDQEYAETLQSYYTYSTAGIAKLGLVDDPARNTFYKFNEDIIKLNNSTFKDFYTYAQTRVNITNPDTVDSNLGFLPFNLSLDLDGIGGIKIYNRLIIDSKFLPSNYPQSLDFIVTGVNHKLTNDQWITSLDTLATSKSTFNTAAKTLITEKIFNGSIISPPVNNPPNPVPGPVVTTPAVSGSVMTLATTSDTTKLAPRAYKSGADIEKAIEPGKLILDAALAAGKIGQKEYDLRMRMIKVAGSYVGQETEGSNRVRFLDASMDAEQWSTSNKTSAKYGGGRIRAQKWKNDASTGTGQAYCNYTQMLFWYEAIEAGNNYVPATTDYQGNYKLKSSTFNFYTLYGDQSKLFADYSRFKTPYKKSMTRAERNAASPQRYYSYGMQTPGCPFTAQVFEAMDYYEKVSGYGNGILDQIKKLAKNYTILPGDSIMFDWSASGNKKGSNIWQIDHIGMYLSVDDSSSVVTTIEGNNNTARMAAGHNGIWKRTRGGDNIHGFCRLPVKYLYGL